MPLNLSRSFVDSLLLRRPEESLRTERLDSDPNRFLQNTPILLEVWQAFAEKPIEDIDVAITPHETTAAPALSREIYEAIKKERPPASRIHIAYLESLIVAKVSLDELAYVILPRTAWWRERIHRVAAVKDDGSTKAPVATARRERASREIGRVAYLVTCLMEAAKAASRPGSINTIEELWAALGEAGEARLEEKLEITRRRLIDLGSVVKSPQRDGGATMSIWRVSMNREASLAITRSVPTVKGDAALKVFGPSCKDLVWAVVDSGIDGSHRAFMLRDGSGTSRVKKTYDFTKLHEIHAELREAAETDTLAFAAKWQELTKRPLEAGKEAETRVRIQAWWERAAPDWFLLEPFLSAEEGKSVNPQPSSPHGTHVAGIIGADWKRDDDTTTVGMCPDITLYDLRVLADNERSTEFAIVAALQFVRHLNRRNNRLEVHGVNLSVQIPHDAANDACGHTPVCEECERLVASGVVVVAAAGNRGASLLAGTKRVEQVHASSITDPGNAENVITVGSTHRTHPHMYGVSYFSSRGPTSDGRAKPDLVAPGERITAPVPDGEAQQHGTSMAAPHVSGGAALLMARYPELIGQPLRIKKILCSTATDLGRERSFQGAGMLDVLRALQSI